MDDGWEKKRKKLEQKSMWLRCECGEVFPENETVEQYIEFLEKELQRLGRPMSD